MARNFLKGVLGDAINLFMAAAAFNFRKWMRKLACFFVPILLWLRGETRNDLATQLNARLIHAHDGTRASFLLLRLPWRQFDEIVSNLEEYEYLN
jgi:hypothetical protein